MKQISYLFAFLILSACGHTNSGKQIEPHRSKSVRSNSSIISAQNKSVSHNTAKERQDDTDSPKQALRGFEKASLYKLTETIAADFNGDGFVDHAFFKKDGISSGIIIIHGKTNEEVTLGFGKPFAHLSQFDWVDYWGLVEDRETSETIFTEEGDILESRKIILQNPSIIVGENEVGGGLITYLNGKYVWVHQTC